MAAARRSVHWQGADQTWIQAPARQVLAEIRTCSGLAPYFCSYFCSQRLLSSGPGMGRRAIVARAGVTPSPPIKLIPAIQKKCARVYVLGENSRDSQFSRHRSSRCRLADYPCRFELASQLLQSEAAPPTFFTSLVPVETTSKEVSQNWKSKQLIELFL